MSSANPRNRCQIGPHDTQAATAAKATTQALEMQMLAEQHSAEGNLAQALDAIRQANR